MIRGILWAVIAFGLGAGSLFSIAHYHANFVMTGAELRSELTNHEDPMMKAHGEAVWEWHKTRSRTRLTDLVQLTKVYNQNMRGTGRFRIGDERRMIEHLTNHKFTIGRPLYLVSRK